MQDAPEVQITPLVSGYVHINPQDDPVHYIARGTIDDLGFPHIDFGTESTRLVVGESKNPHPQTGLHYLSFRLGVRSDIEKAFANMTSAMQEKLLQEGPALVMSLHKFAAMHASYAPTCEDLIVLIAEVRALEIEDRPRPANDAKRAFAPTKGTLETGTTQRPFAPLLDPTLPLRNPPMQDYR